LTHFELKDTFQIDSAVKVLHAGGVIAYPTEYCYGLGCDPRNESALDKLLKIKQRAKAQGVILIAANITQVKCYAEIDQLSRKDEILASWPGPNTWLLPAHKTVPNWVRGKHLTIALRIPGHELSRQLCSAFEHPIVSTSANRHGQPAHRGAPSLRADLGDEIDLVIDAPLGLANSASTIRDGVTGETLR